MNSVITHTIHSLCPSPTKTDATIRNFTDFIMLDINITHIPRSNGETSPVLNPNFREIAIIDLLVCAYFPAVSRIIRQMRFVSNRRKATGQQTISCNIAKETTTNNTALHRFLIIQSGRTQMFKSATLKINLPGSSYPDSSRRTTQPSLIIQRMIQIIPLHLRINPVPIRQIHTCLKRHMSFLRRTHPRSIRKSNFLKANMTHRTIQSTFYLY